MNWTTVERSTFVAGNGSFVIGVILGSLISQLEEIKEWAESKDFRKPYDAFPPQDSEGPVCLPGEGMVALLRGQHKKPLLQTKSTYPYHRLRRVEIAVCLLFSMIIHGHQGRRRSSG
ncbi:hypothetical protein BHE74_00000676 [Ensete ventricosum]|nr:hypothetical protein BHE74_00000676 [Ensete ventricosum]